MCVLLEACATGHQQFYRPYVDPKTLTDVQFLREGESPKIFSSNNLRTDVKIAISKGYRPIGSSSFNGELESEQAIVNQAKAVGAVFVLTTSRFAETRTTTTPLYLPNTQTTYSSGTVYNAYGNANYSGSSTSYGTTVVPITTQQQRYDQESVYFVRNTVKPKFGVFPIDLPPELKSRYERNTGALIDIVMENSPAFSANILAGDVLIEVDGVAIINAKQSLDVLKAASPTNGRCVLKVIRNGLEKSIEVKL
jgi:hypothetical protein